MKGRIFQNVQAYQLDMMEQQNESRSLQKMYKSHANLQTDANAVFYWRTLKCHKLNQAKSQKLLIYFVLELFFCCIILYFGLLFHCQEKIYSCPCHSCLASHNLLNSSNSGQVKFTVKIAVIFSAGFWIIKSMGQDSVYCAHIFIYLNIIDVWILIDTNIYIYCQHQCLSLVLCLLFILQKYEYESAVLNCQ